MKLSPISLLWGSMMATLVSSQELVDIPTTAVNNGSFTTLVAALGAADLVSALSPPNGPFTVFAPVDSAFAALPDGLVSCLLLPENQAALVSILTYHVVSDEFVSTELVDGMTLTTLNGAAVTIDLDGIFVNDATVLTLDVATSNGVIHAIDSVLVPPGLDVAAFLATCPPTETMPPSMDIVDIPTTAVNNGFTTLVAALETADLVTTLSPPNGPFTVFAPTDAAFAALPDGLVSCLLLPESRDFLISILTYHVLNGEVLSTDLVGEQMSVPTLLSGANLTINLMGPVMINNANLVLPDVRATNGVIHVIDAVLVPPDIDVEAFLFSCPTPVIDTPPIAPPPETSDPLPIPSTITDLASADPSLNELVNVLLTLGLADDLAGPGPFTVFAPVNDAFLKIADVTATLDAATLTRILGYHVIVGEAIPRGGFTNGDLEVTLSNITLPVAVVPQQGTIFVGTFSSFARVVGSSITASNGIIHKINSVLIPPAPVPLPVMLADDGDDDDDDDDDDDED